MKRLALRLLWAVVLMIVLVLSAQPTVEFVYRAF